MAILDDNEVDLDALGSRVAAWLRRQPGQAEAAVRALRQASTANGFSNETYRFTLASAGRHDEELILRLPPARIGLFPDYDLARQYAFMDHLAREPGLRMARCRWLESDRAALGRPFFITDFVSGNVAGDNPPYLHQGWIVDATSAQRQSLWDGTMDQLVHMARVRWQGDVLSQLDWPDRAQSRMQQHLAMWGRLGAWGHAQIPGPVDPLQIELLQWLHDHEPSEAPAGVVWGDSRFGNVIFDDFRPVALLDWELAVIGDPMIDLAYLLFHVFLYELYHGDTNTRERTSGFRSDRETVARYCDRTGRSPAPYRTYWLFNAYKMLCIWECKSAMMVRTGNWSMEQGLLARRAEKLKPVIVAMMAGGDDAAYLR